MLALRQKYDHLIFFILLLILTSCTPTNNEQIDALDLPVISLDISSTDMLKIRYKREKAIQQGLLVTKSSDYVAAQIVYEGKPLEGEVRLKGDWLDHLRGNKWSWRVKLADSCQVEGMQRFSLQHPRVRSYLDEWVFHQLLEQEGVLTPRYTFVQVILNGKYKGVYALEEHFDKALLHKHQRPEGPILKFNEDGFWQAQTIHKRTGENLTHFMPVFESAEIEAFQKNSILKDPNNKACFQAGKKKLESMRMAEGKASDLVNVDLVARWYALCDLVESYHSLRWHNMRFYYHPIKGVLEPVVYDAFGSQGAYRWFRKPLLGSYNEKSDTVWLAEEMLVFSLFNDHVFRKSYHHYLEAYSKPAFIENFNAKIKPELERWEKILHQEFPDYEYDTDQLKTGAERLRKELDDYIVYPPEFERFISPLLFDSCRSDLPIPKVALKVNRVSKSAVQLENWFCQPITLKAIGKKKSDQRAVENIELPAFTSKTWPPSVYELSVKEGDQYFYYSVPANDSWFRQKISPWPMPTKQVNIPLTDLRIDTTFMHVEGQKIFVKKGRYQLSKMIIIPKEYELLVESDVQIDMIARSAMIICGNVQMNGEKEKRIRLYSSDQSSCGIHMMGTSTMVKISYVDFLGHGDWWGPERWFKGGLSILESKVDINHCTFNQMRGEDALNIVSSNQVVLRDLSFSNCEGDGLDLDYCKATLEDLFFENIGGDGLDFSGSQVKGEGLEMNTITDKGISIGEESFVDFQYVNITNSMLGVGVKDGSSAILNDLSLNSCEYGVAVFNKKPIFTTASAEMNHFHYDDVVTPYVLEENHHLSIDREERFVTHEKYQLFKVFYPVEDH